LLQRWVERLTPGRALDVACGTGRNTLLLAASGWQALGIDISPVALHLARAEAQRQSLEPDLVAANLADWPLPVAYFDLVCVFRFLDRSLCPALVATLKPGGVLIYETFTIAQRGYEGGPRSDALLLQPGELPTLFPGCAALEYNEGVIEEDGRPRALAGLVARRTI
jgi:SAM-dependent methyltransferase